MNRRDPEENPVIFRYWPIAAALSAGLASTVLLLGILRYNAQHTDQDRFDTLTHFMQERLDDRVEKCEQALALIRELFNHVELPSQTAWQQLLDRLKLPVNYPGLVQVGYAPRLTGAQLAQPSSRLRAAMETNCVLPKPLLPDAIYMPVLYVSRQPLLPAGPTGFRLDTSRLQPNIPNTRDRNAISATRRLPLGLPESLDTLHGCYMIQSVYDADLPVETYIPGEDTTLAFQRLSNQRGPHHRGSVFGAIQMDLLLEDLLENAPMEIAFEIFDGPKIQESQRLNQRTAIPSVKDRSRRLDLRNRVSTWRMYGERWTIVFYPTLEFEQLSPLRAFWTTLVGGLFATLCVTGLVWVQLQRQFSAESYARQMNEARDLIDTLSRDQRQISRDLHDGVLQSLYALGLGLRKIQKAIQSDPVKAAEVCGQNLAALELAMDEVRGVLGKPGDLPPEDMDLVNTLRYLTEAMNCQGCVPVEFHSDDLLATRPRPGLALQMLQIAREAVSNAQRHGGAQSVQVALHSRRGGLEMTIADNGVGFDPERLPMAGYGLQNMFSRARDMGADCRLQTQPGAGVRLTVYLPATHCVVTAPAAKPSIPTTHASI